MDKFNQAFAELIGNEGGYKCEATDRMDWTSGTCGVGVLRGTNYGISAGTYPSLDIRNLSLDQAREIYKREWWDRFKGDELPYELGFQVFDSEVNHGKKMGVKFLQRALGIVDDGYFGPATAAALAGKDEDKIIMRFLAIRMRYFTSIKTWDEYGRGWANRVADNLIKATE
jgi:lysozyme family protein